MKLDPIIQALRARCPSFSQRVGGAAQFRNLPENINLQVPAAFVVPLDDNPEPNRSQNGFRQTLKESFAVIVVLSNADERGQSSANAVHDIRQELWQALLGWQITEDHDPIEYEGAALLEIDRARIWYQFEFGTQFEIGDEDTYQHSDLESKPDFEGVNLQVDIIDPAADPNLQYPGPDGRIEHEAQIDTPTS